VGEVRLRPVTRDDIGFLVSQHTAEGGGPYNWFGFRSETEILGRFEDDGFLGERNGKLVVELETADGPVPIGDVSWHAVDYGPPPASRCWNIGISLDPEWRGQGHGTRAQRLLADYLFATTLVERVEASTDVENTPERRALERAGFSFEGVLRRAQFRSGAWRDMAQYSLIRGE
jgi:RimJ/RimL family protein N-acetyltransferase